MPGPRRFPAVNGWALFTKTLASLAFLTRGTGAPPPPKTETHAARLQRGEAEVPKLSQIILKLRSRLAVFYAFRGGSYLLHVLII